MKTTNKEKWMDTQDQKILLHECKGLIFDFVIYQFDSNSVEKEKLMDKAKELIVKLKNY